ncbi:hypothetical protein Tco_1002613 [Tanacetum coccineum]|uniref:Uncharacterized protein n=1 Tax=Tanacetum coccineum TaxID=301880 RepID=A0ABQ5F6Y8_9ASTR
MMMMMMKMVYDDGGGSGWRWWRVRESDGGDRIDREMGRIFGVGRKSSPENFSGGCGGGRRLPELAGEDEWEREMLTFKDLTPTRMTLFVKVRKKFDFIYVKEFDKKVEGQYVGVVESKECRRSGVELRSDETKSMTCGSSTGYAQDDIDIIDVDDYWINRKGSV